MPNTDLADALRASYPATAAYVEALSLGSAERGYCARYVASRLMDIERPAASGWGVGVDHAAQLRERVDEALVDDGVPRP